MSLEQKRYFESGKSYERERIIKILRQYEIIHTRRAEELIRKQEVED